MDVLDSSYIKAVGVKWPGLKNFCYFLVTPYPERMNLPIEYEFLDLKLSPHELQTLLHSCKVTRYTMISLKFSGILEKCKVIT